MAFDDLLAYGEPHPNTFVFFPRMEALENDENAIGVLHVNANAIIAD